MVLIEALALAGLGYLAIFMDDFPQNMPGFMARFITRIFCVMGLSALICVPAFLCLQAIYRKRLADGREECRQRAARFLESRLANPRVTSPSQEVRQPRMSEPVVRSPTPGSDDGPAELMTGR